MKKEKNTTTAEQFLITIGNIVETGTITIHLTDKYISSDIDHFNQ
jgi:hypothetical protein